MSELFVRIVFGIYAGWVCITIIILIILKNKRK